jgi:hypothetical protein
MPKGGLPELRATPRFHDMKLGRREFMKFVTAAIAGVPGKLSSDVFQSPRFYVDKGLGFGFEIPRGWYLEAFREDFHELLGGQTLAPPYEDDRETMMELSQGLLATLSKYPIVGDPVKRFSPSITFFRGDESCMEDHENLMDLTSKSMIGFRCLLTDYECMEEPQFVRRSDCVMVRGKSRFLFEHREIEPVLIDDEMFVVHHQRSIYTIHLYDSPYGGDTSQDEFRIFRESLHIA